MGKGSGGTSLDDPEHFHYIDACRECHNLIHAKLLTFEVAGNGDITWYRDGAMAVSTTTSDEELCELWAAGDRWGKAGIAMQARAALEFRARYGAYGEGWYKRAGELIRENTGCPVSQTTIFDRCALGIFLQACGDDAEQALMTLGTKVATAVGKSADPVAGLEQAHTMRDAGERMSIVAREIALSGRSQEREPCVEHVCRRCNERWEG
mgnify:CR=1 FL=1